MMRSFVGQPLFRQFIITLCLFLTLSNAEVSYPVDENGKRITDCTQLEVEEMSKHVYVEGDSPNDIELKCPLENAYMWENKLQQSPLSQFYQPIYNPDDHSLETEHSYSVSGESLETYALNIGKPDKALTGFYCCSHQDASRAYRYFPIVSHAVLILSKAPVINLTFSNSKPVKNGNKISLHCSKPTNNHPKGYPKPTIFWEKNSVEMAENNEQELAVEDTEENSKASFRCGWKYKNLANGGSKTFYSNYYNVTTVIVDELSNEVIKVDIGDSIMLTCVFKGGLPVHKEDLRWTKQKVIKYSTEVDVPTDNEVKYGHNVTVDYGDYGFTTNFSLTIYNFGVEDHASYRCIYKKDDPNKIERGFQVEDQRYCPKRPVSNETTTESSSGRTEEPSKTDSSNGQCLSLGLILVSLLTTVILT